MHHSSFVQVHSLATEAGVEAVEPRCHQTNLPLRRLDSVGEIDWQVSSSLSLMRVTLPAGNYPLSVLRRLTGMRLSDSRRGPIVS